MAANPFDVDSAAVPRDRAEGVRENEDEDAPAPLTALQKRPAADENETGGV
jgi:hypothetical protein